MWIVRSHWLLRRGNDSTHYSGQGQTSLFSCAEPNANDLKCLFELISIRFGAWKSDVWPTIACKNYWDKQFVSPLPLITRGSCPPPPCAMLLKRFWDRRTSDNMFSTLPMGEGGIHVKNITKCEESHYFCTRSVYIVSSYRNCNTFFPLYSK